MNETIASRIRQRRKELKLTQDKIAEHCGINRVSVSNWETEGKNGTSPKGANLLSLAELLGVTPEWLQFGKGQKLASVQKLSGDSLNELLAVSTPRTQTELLKIAQAAADGRLSEQDVQLLKLIADRLSKKD